MKSGLVGTIERTGRNPIAFGLTKNQPWTSPGPRLLPPHCTAVVHLFDPHSLLAFADHRKDAPQRIDSLSAVEPKPVPDKRRFGCHPPCVRRRDRRGTDGEARRAEGAASAACKSGAGRRMAYRYPEERRDPRTSAAGHFTGTPAPIGRSSKMATAAEPGR